MDLIQEYNSIVDEFKKRYGMLADVHDRTQLKIKQVTGLRDGVCFYTLSSVSKFPVAADEAYRYPPSRTWWTRKPPSPTTRRRFNRGNNIRTLTYITIAYLPLGFITVSLPITTHRAAGDF